MEFREALVYGTPANTPDFALPNASMPTPAAAYPTIGAAQAALDAVAGACTSFISYGERAPGAPLRCNLSMAIVPNAGNNSVDETLWLVMPTGLDGKQGVRLEKLGALTWVASATAVDPAIGARAGHNWAASVTITDTGLAVSRGGVALTKVNQTPCLVTLFDAGNYSGILRVMARNAALPATSFAPLHERWR